MRLDAGDAQPLGHPRRGLLTPGSFIERARQCAMMCDIDAWVLDAACSDLARWLADGRIDYLGRNDDQVKLHGFRIELNEITSVLNDLNFVLQAETIPLKRNGEVKKIVSLVQLKSGEEKDKDWKTELIAGLNSKLPYYMIPSDFKIIDKMPLNQNGKADKKMLEQMYLAKS